MNVKQIVQSGAPDEDGSQVPAGVIFGTVRIERADGLRKPDLAIVGAMYDPVAGMCGEHPLPCVGVLYTWIVADPTTGFVGQSSSISHFAYWDDSTVTLENWQTSFTSTSPSIIAVDQSGWVDFLQPGQSYVDVSAFLSRNPLEDPFCAPIIFAAVALALAEPPSIVAVNIDAVTPVSTKATYSTQEFLSSVTFTAPGKTETRANVQPGEFSFVFDQSNVPIGQSLIKIVSGAIEVSVTATRVQKKAPAVGLETEIVLVRVPQDDLEALVLVPMPHDLFERFDSISYSIPVVTGSKTIRAISSSVNLSTPVVQGVSTEIALWEERHLYQDIEAESLNQVMPDVTFSTLPPQGPNFRSKFATSQGFFKPGNGLTGIGRFVNIFFQSSEGLVAGLFPVKVDVDLALEANAGNF